MKNLDVKHWYAIEKIMDNLKEEQKATLTSNSTPLEIADTIRNIEMARNTLQHLLENWKEEYGYPNVSNLKYISKF